jgi:hypothetical protein
MRYFNNALGDRRFYIIEINPYGNSYTPPTDLRMSLIGGQTLTQATANNRYNTGNNLGDSFSSNTSKLFNDAITPWTGVGAFSPGSTGACLPRYSDLSPGMRAHIDKFGELPTYVGDDGKVHVDREAQIQRVVDYYAGPEGGSMKLGGFSAERFANAGHDERMSMLRDMRKENDAAKAAKFEEDLRLAQERDAARECANNPVAQSGVDRTGQIIASVGAIATRVIPLLF